MQGIRTEPLTGVCPRSSPFLFIIFILTRLVGLVVTEYLLGTIRISIITSLEIPHREDRVHGITGDVVVLRPRVCTALTGYYE